MVKRGFAANRLGVSDGTMVSSDVANVEHDLGTMVIVDDDDEEQSGTMKRKFLPTPISAHLSLHWCVVCRDGHSHVVNDNG